MSELTVSLVQLPLYWEQPAKNRSSIEHIASQIDSTDLIILPEMFTTGFSMNVSDQAEQMDGPTIDWMRKMADNHQAIVCGSLIIQDKGRFYNRLIWMQPNGSFEYYDKRHLFSMADENKHFKAGEKKLITHLKGWKICPLICYDLRFPVWSRNTNTELEYEFDLLIYIANWPSPRTSAWEKLLYARAIENQCYIAGVNRVGKDEKGLDYDGSSLLIDMKGDTIWKGNKGETIVQTQRIDLSTLQEFRQKFPAIRDADQFQFIQ